MYSHFKQFAFLAALLAVCVSADARMYAWIDPISGSVQMSGKPPAWYRGNLVGPRVRVFEQGIVVDDTAIAVSPEQQAVLREEAFRQFEYSRELQALKHLESQAIKDAEREQRVSQAEPDLSDELADEAPSVPESIGEQTIEQLKDLLDQWDQINVQ